MERSLAEIPVARWLEAASPERVRAIIQFLQSQGTFRFPSLSTGLFSAAAFDHPDGELTGYQSVWTRDTVQIAHALWLTDDPAAAIRAMTALGEFYIRSRPRFEAIIARPGLAADPMQRPHIRFDGESMSELPEKWSHAQNDALGYWLWFTCRLIVAEDLRLTAELAQTLGLLVRYFQAVEFWHDADSGHWEEVRKVAASSIGVALGGLKLFRNVLELEGEAFADRSDLRRLTDQLIERGEQSLREILPAECVQGDATQRRAHDAALLFLIYPLQVVSGPMAEEIVRQVQEHLQGPIGIRRYNGDSYWCANYKTLLSAEVRTSDFSDDLASRDALLRPGTEAQWCIFDPIVSIFYGRRYLELGEPVDLEQQLNYLQRALLQLTGPESRFGSYRCPESYYLEGDQWVPNDICPLLWTQANLRLALYWLEQSLQGTAD
jgi:phosphorylase kinase alpha/beta subunit